MLYAVSVGKSLHVLHAFQKKSKKGIETSKQDLALIKDRLKADLGIEIFRILEDRKLTQKAAANLLGVKQPEISRLKKGEFSHYSVSRLFTFLNHLNRNVEVHIRRAPDNEAYQRVIAL